MGGPGKSGVASEDISKGGREPSPCFGRSQDRQDALDRKIVRTDDPDIRVVGYFEWALFH